MKELDLLEAAVLAAIFRGLDTVDALRKVINVDKNVLESVLNKLIAEGLVSVELRGILFKKPRLRLTRKGIEYVEKAFEKLKQVATKAAHVEQGGQGNYVKASDATDDFMTTFTSILPLLIWLELLDASFLAAAQVGQEGSSDLGEEEDYAGEEPVEGGEEDFEGIELGDIEGGELV